MISMKFSKVIMNVTVILFLSHIISSAQGTPDDYARADGLVDLTSDKVFHSDIKPSWIGGTNYFLYENFTAEGIEYIIVNAINQTKRPAFDQKRFAAAFGAVTDRKFEPGKLQLSNIIFSDKLRSFAFVWNDYNWICSLKDYRIIRRDRVSSRESSGLYNWSFRDELSNNPVVSPDKKWTAFIREYNVWVRSDSDKKEYQLSYDGGIGEYYSSFIKWSPDSKKLVSCLVKPAEKHIIHFIESSPVEQLQPRHYSFEYPKPGDAVPQFYPQLFDVGLKKHIKIDGYQLINQYAINNITWSKKSRYFTFEYNRRGHQLFQIIKVDSDSIFPKTIINETSPTFIDYSGKRYRYDLEETDEIIWASERDGWNHLYLYDSGSGEVKNQITDGEWVVTDVAFVDAKKRQIIFKAVGMEPGDPYFVYYYRSNLDGTGLTRLTEGNGKHEVIFYPDKK